MLKPVRSWKQWSRWIGVGIMVMALGLGGCGGGRSLDSGGPVIRRMSEVSPPQVVQALSTQVANRQPSVAIVSPKADQVVKSDTVSLTLRVNDFPVFKDETLGVGPHIDLLLDNQFYREIYDTTSAIVLEEMTPGTHTLRAIASWPWDESVKDPSAQDQVIFHVFTQTPLTAPAPGTPVLTYHQPIGQYGAEPILLDYVLDPGAATSAAGSPGKLRDMATAGWTIRATVNGESFTFDLLEPIYLKGFKVGKNWVQLELLDRSGNSVEGLFNNTARLITYQPGGDDTLSQLMRDELSATAIAMIVDPDYVVPVVETPEDEETLENETTQETTEADGSNRSSMDAAAPAESDPSPDTTADGPVPKPSLSPTAPPEAAAPSRIEPEPTPVPSIIDPMSEDDNHLEPTNEAEIADDTEAAESQPSVVAPSASAPENGTTPPETEDSLEPDNTPDNTMDDPALLSPSPDEAAEPDTINEAVSGLTF